MEEIDVARMRECVRACDPSDGIMVQMSYDVRTSDTVGHEYLVRAEGYESAVLKKERRD